MNEAVRNRLHWLIPLAAAWVWFCTVANQSAEQVLNLQNIENYALAVFCQLFWMWSTVGEWAQTIHFGYVDSWMWSGHRVGWLPFVGWVYGIDPDPVWLTRVQIAVLSLGAFPAWGMGRDEIDRRYGGFLGLVLYLGFPPLAAIALQDYQDLVLSIPFILGAVWQCRRGSLVGFAAFAVAAAMCREELVPMVALIGLVHPGHWRARLHWLTKGVGIAALYGAVIWWLGRDFSGYDNPMMSHSGDMVLQWPPVWTRDWSDFGNFYSAFLKPVQFLALLSPLTAAPGLGALFFHLTAPAHGGVDTAWGGHIHHMAPVVGFVVAATIEGVGRVARWTRGWRLLRKPALILGGAGLIITVGLAAKPWMAFLNLSPAIALERPTDIAPEWAFLEHIPDDAAVATDSHLSLIIANRAEAFTYDESLADKRPGKGLSAVDFIIVRKGDKSWREQVVLAKGKAVAETRLYELFDLRD
jgi:hypothetical protein